MKRAIMIERRWGSLPDNATRCEFQVRGVWLKAKYSNCRTVEEVFAALDGLTEYLVTGFFRLVDGPVDRANKNQQR